MEKAVWSEQARRRWVVKQNNTRGGGKNITREEAGRYNQNR